ncbi:vomeronasal type-2 receptor 26-like [Protopterus annectens]|uniref:vomeronasal type-2 receptor 26-like n=1 Tax=Protopterus annectens TaxID=7888 RepID=UPI001CFA3C7D|nr:vomeronasal type-2 receptor 26-like [Protopterus annectens]
MLGMVFTISEINQNPKLLSNITLGFKIYDSCFMEIKAIQSAMSLLSGKQVPIANYCCKDRPLLSGLVGDIMSSLSIPIARILGLYHFPQISPGANHPILSDKMQFPSFLRTLPHDKFNNKALAQLIIHFGWIWIGIVSADSDIFQTSSQQIKSEIQKLGGCIAFSEQISIFSPTEKLVRLANLIKESSVNVIILNSDEVQIQPMLNVLHIQKITGKVFILTANCLISTVIFTEDSWNLLNGSLGLVLYSSDMPGFQDFLSALNPYESPHDIFIKLFWEKAFNCKWPGTNTSGTVDHREAQLCSGAEKLPEIVASLFELHDLSYTYQTYLAMLHYVKHVNFKTTIGEDFYFGADSDPVPIYSIINIQIFPNNTYKLIKTGKIDSRASQEDKLNINIKTILWPEVYNEIPRSICSDSCLPGHRKMIRQGQSLCCFDCIPCSAGDISNETDAVDCLKCPEDKWPNERHTKCIPKAIEFLAYEDPLGVTLVAISGFFSFTTVLVMYIFIKYRETPIVKANNRDLSYLLLVSLMLCFLCTLMFIGKPENVTCMLRQTVFGTIFSMSVSSVLAKTITVVIAFKATNPNSNLRHWVCSKTPYLIIFFGTFCQIILCMIWLAILPPFPELHIQVMNPKVIFECNEGQGVFFYCMLGYMGLLASVSFIVAFVARQLPDSFNEAKHITFSMLVFVSVWLSFIPAYLSTQGKYMVAVEIFAILSSSAGLLSCIFCYKCYIILLRPSQNDKKHLMGKLTFSNNT